MDTAFAVVAGLVLAIVAFRRVRGVVGPRPAARPPARESRWVRYERWATTLMIAVRVGLGLAAVVAIAALARRLFH